MRQHYLQKVFEPESVAVVGASERPMLVGAQVLRNLVEGEYTGEIYPVNPKYQALQGRQCFASIQEIDYSIDLVIVAVPAPAIPAVKQRGSAATRSAPPRPRRS